MAVTLKAKKWTQIRAKNNFARWAKVKAAAAVMDVDARKLAKSLIDADENHGFRLASDENEATKRPEHFCSADGFDYEETILINAVTFTVSRYAARFKGHDRVECTTFPEAVAKAGKDPRSLVYATAASGRDVCLGRAQWDWFSALWYVFKG